MTIDEQLREIARHAEQHQRVITADEIVRRASGSYLAPERLGSGSAMGPGGRSRDPRGRARAARGERRRRPRQRPNQQGPVDQPESDR